MTDLERRRQIEDLCDAALARDVPERAAFVAAACGHDEALRHEVEALLAHAQTAERFLESPIGELAAHVLADDHRASLAGLQIGSYQILSLLGTGGMGNVYRARDTRLGRDVAIKVVANVFLSDPERLARFEHEARVLATLNHPHIGAIYGLEEAGGVRGLVLELVEGATLAERLAKGPLPAQEALSVARQIADALEAAHEKGIIHRDLKPANIKITPDGTVKVLDFGLAKVFAKDGSEYDVSAKPSITIEETREGVIAGTAAYMSPEQARGKAVDKRTDIWAFGCVLYEMLTARPPFRGETVSDTIAGILEREADWSALPAETTVSIRRLLQRCLEKDPKRRLRDIGDARLEIEEAPGPSVSSSGSATQRASDRTAPAGRPGRLAWGAAAGLGPVPGERIYLVVRAVDVRSPAQGPGVRYRDALNVMQVVRAAHPGEGGGCHVPPPKWQFSARGNEPFWGVKVYPDSIVLTQPDPPSPLVFPAVTPVPKGRASLWSTARADGSHRLTLYLDPSGCVDGMSGEYFAYTARVTLDGSMRRGCAEQAFAGP